MSLHSALRNEWGGHLDDFPYWLIAPEFEAATGYAQEVPLAAATYRCGDAIFELATDDLDLLGNIAQRYGDCAVAAPRDSTPALLRYEVLGGSVPKLWVVRFLSAAPQDPGAVALALLHPLSADEPYSIRAAPINGWSLVGTVTAPILAASGTGVIIDRQRVSADFLVDFLVSTTLGLQAELLVIHAASLNLQGAGILLMGPSHSGKSTTAIHLAARGHSMLGDEVAVIRAASAEILPCRLTIKLRPGPRAPELDAALERLGIESAIDGDPSSVSLLRVGELFPGAPAIPARLRAIFFLDGFAHHASIERVEPTLNVIDEYDALASEIAYASWAGAPKRWSLKLLVLRHMMARLPCWRLKAGSPGETAQLIEHTMENLFC